jgi:hypothetical protein
MDRQPATQTDNYISSAVAVGPAEGIDWVVVAVDSAGFAESAAAGHASPA